MRLQDLKFQFSLARLHISRRRLWSLVNRGRLITLLEANPAALKRFLTVLEVNWRFGSQRRFRTVLVAKGKRLASRISALFSRCDVTGGRPER